MHFTAADKLLLESWQKLLGLFHLVIKEEVSVPLMQSSGSGKKIPALESLDSAFYIVSKSKYGIFFGNLPLLRGIIGTVA